VRNETHIDEGGYVHAAEKGREASRSVRQYVANLGAEANIAASTPYCVHHTLNVSSSIALYLEVSVADAKLQVLEEGAVLHNIQRVEHVKVPPLGQREAIVHQLRERHRGSDVVERVGGIEGGMLVISDDAGGKVVVAAHIGDFAVFVLDHECVHDTIAWEEPMPELFLGKYAMDLESAGK